MSHKLLRFLSTLVRTVLRVYQPFQSGERTYNNLLIQHHQKHGWLLTILTLEEIDMEYRELALESGIENWGRVPALGLTASITSFGGSNVEIKCRRQRVIRRFQLLREDVLLPSGTILSIENLRSRVGTTFVLVSKIALV